MFIENLDILISKICEKLNIPTINSYQYIQVIGFKHYIQNIEFIIIFIVTFILSLISFYFSKKSEYNEDLLICIGIFLSIISGITFIIFLVELPDVILYLKNPEAFSINYILQNTGKFLLKIR